MIQELKNNKGSLLIEALLSVVILSVSLTLIIQAMTSGIRAISYSTDYTKAMILAENKLVEHIRNQMLDVSVSRTIVNRGDNKDFQYEVSSSSIDDELVDALSKVDVEVSWNRGKRDRSFILETYLMDQKL